MGIIEFLNRIASLLILIPAPSTLFKTVGSFKIGSAMSEIKTIIVSNRKIKVFLIILKTALPFS